MKSRRNLRLPNRDYSRGTYFVTVCALKSGAVFGEVADGEMHLNEAGRIVADCWRWLATHYRHVTLDEWCVLPDHLHGILVLAEPDAQAATAVHKKRKPLGQLIGAFKTVSTKQVNQRFGTPGAVLWQRDFWDRVIRNRRSIDPARRYIRDNPRNLPVAFEFHVGDDQWRGGS